MEHGKYSSVDERRKQQDFLSVEGMREIKDLSDKVIARQKAGVTISPITQEQEAKINSFITSNSTWRSRIPGLRTNEYWRLRAEFYPYNNISDASDDFFLRGTTHHPRLSEYPMCNDVIRDYFNCRDSIFFMYLTNTCVPMKEQLSSCINNVFIRNHRRTDAKFNAQRDDFFEERRDKKLKRMLDTITIGADHKGKLQD